MVRKIFIGICLLALPAVAIAQTRVDFDRHKDFSRHKTFTVELGTLVRAAFVHRGEPRHDRRVP
jgi:hypothetical protein